MRFATVGHRRAAVCLTLLLAVLAGTTGCRGDEAKRTLCMNNLKQIGTAIAQLRTRGGPPTSLEAMVEAGLLAASDIRCPASSGDRTCDYVYAPLVAMRPSPESIMASDIEPHDGKFNVLMASGSVISMSEADFRSALREARNETFAGRFFDATD